MIINKQPSNDLVQVEGLSCDFDVSSPWLNRVLEHKPKQFPKAVNNVTFSIAKGKTLALVGESGSGKSTIEKMLVGLQTPTAGEMRFNGLKILMPINFNCVKVRK